MHRFSARFALLIGAAVISVGCSGTSSPTSTPAPPTAPASPIPTAGPTSTPRPTPTPVVGEGICPTNSPLTVIQFTESNAACFGGADIVIQGWLDEPPGVGFEGPPIEPSWVAYPAPGLPSLWTTKPVGPDHLCPPDAGPCGWFFLHLDPASGLNLDIAPKEIIVTGHLDDPAAATCHYVFPDDWTDERPDDAQAVEGCRGHFVVVSFRDAP